MMVRKVFLLAIALLFTLSIRNCEAATWVKLGQINAGEVIAGYVDKDSIQNTSGRFFSIKSFEIWEKWTFTPPRLLNNKAVQEILYFSQYKNNQQYCVKEVVYVYSDKSRINANPPCDYQRVTPDSINELTWQYIFKTYVPSQKKQRPKPTPSKDKDIPYSS